MNDLIVGIGLVLVIEGILYAAFPGAVRQMIEVVRASPDRLLRAGGLLAAALGVVIVWLIRG